MPTPTDAQPVIQPHLGNVRDHIEPCTSDVTQDEIMDTTENEDDLVNKVSIVSVGDALVFVFDAYDDHARCILLFRVLFGLLFGKVQVQYYVVPASEWIVTRPQLYAHIEVYDYREES